MRLLTLLLLPIAAYAYLEAMGIGFAVAWAEADPYVMETPRAARRAHRLQVARATAPARVEGRRMERLAAGLALVALALAIAAEWRARHNVRTWPWRAALGLAMLAWACVLDDDVWRLWRIWFTALAFALAALDLRLRRPGPRRKLAWLTLALAVSFACSLALRRPILKALQPAMGTTRVAGSLQAVRPATFALPNITVRVRVRASISWG